MKVSYLKLSVTLMVVQHLVCVQNVYAQDTKGARFNYAPNYWKVERPLLPSAANDNPVQGIQNGAVPNKTSFLVDPNMLSRPNHPTQTSTNRVSNQLSIPKVSFNPAFGNSLVSKPSVPMAAQMQNMKAANKANPEKIMHKANNARHIHTNVAGKLLHKPGLAGQTATPASYGKGFGYTPGGFLPTCTGDTINAHADVHGKLIR